LPQEPILGEEMTWNVEHMMDVERFEVDVERIYTIVGEVFSNEQVLC
jgi:hypothetical protein